MTARSGSCSRSFPCSGGFRGRGADRAAAIFQGKYLELHERLFAERGRATKPKALLMASELGLDAAKLETDMHSQGVEEAIAANKRLAERLHVEGVPFYLVGDRPRREPTGIFMRSLPPAWPRSGNMAASPSAEVSGNAALASGDQSLIATGTATPPATPPTPAPIGPPTAKSVTAPTPTPLATPCSPWRW